MNTAVRRSFVSSLSGWRHAIGLSLLTLLPGWVQAQGLPQLDPPVRGEGDNIVETLQNYGFDILLLVALAVISSMFVGVCYHAYTRYAAIHMGKSTWGEFGLTVAIGALLLVVGIWLVTTATEIL